MKSYSISKEVISWKGDLEETMLVAPTLTTLVAPSMTTPTLSNEDVIDTSVLLKNIGFSLVAAKKREPLIVFPGKMLIGKRMILQYK
jgi:hypothetical protein